MNMSRLCVCDTVTCDASTYIAYKLLLVNCVADVLRTVFVCKDIFASQDFSACRITTSHKTQLLHTSCGSILWGCDNPAKNGKGTLLWSTILLLTVSLVVASDSSISPALLLFYLLLDQIGSDQIHISSPVPSILHILLFFFSPFALRCSLPLLLSECRCADALQEKADHETAIR